MGDEEPGLGGGDGIRPILGQSAAASEPGEGAFDNPAARQDLEALGAIGTFDNLHRPIVDLFQGAMQFRPPIAGVIKSLAKAGYAAPDGG